MRRTVASGNIGELLFSPATFVCTTSVVVKTYTSCYKSHYFYTLLIIIIIIFQSTNSLFFVGKLSTVATPQTPVIYLHTNTSLLSCKCVYMYTQWQKVVDEDKGEDWSRGLAGQCCYSRYYLHEQSDQFTANIIYIILLLIII